MNDAIQPEPEVQGLDARSVILEAGIAMLSQRPFVEVGVRDLMKGTPFTRSVFYKHFDDLYDLIHQVVEDFAVEIFANTDGWIGVPADRDPSRVRDGILQVMQFVAVYGPLVQAISIAAAQDERVFQVWREDFMGEMIKRVANAIREEQVLGHIDESVDADQASLVLNLMNERVIIDQFGRAGNVDPAQVAKSLSDVWLATLYAIRPGDSQ